jgi:type I restriction enzyme R subunit
MGTYAYTYKSSVLSEDDFERALLEHLHNNLKYNYRYGPETIRSNDKYQDIFLNDKLLESLARINHILPKIAIDEAIETISHITDGSLIKRNKEFTGYLQNGVTVSYRDRDTGKIEHDIVYLIDFNDFAKNDFTAVNQWTYVEHQEKRPDVILFVNGMPLVVFELKSPSRNAVDYTDAYQQIRNYLQAIPTLFVYNVFCVISDMTTTKVGTITSDEGRYSIWKSVDGQTEITRFADYTTMLDGMLEHERLLDIIRSFVCFSNDEHDSKKILAAYHQYFAVKKAAESVVNASQNDGKGGVFWHTQGSGKSLSMVFLAKLLQSRMESPTIVVITDRNDLDDQLYSQFSACKDFLRQTPVQAKSQGNLIELLEGREANGIIFTTMQKFTEDARELSIRRNIVVMADEAHRSHYGLEERIITSGRQAGKVVVGDARKIREALPNATYIGFTGTPIAAKDKNTQEVFGNYIDIYDMTQAVEDEATRPVYYESRVVKLDLDDSVLEQLDLEYETLAEQASVESIEKSKRELSRMESVLGAPEVIDALCQDIIDHYEQTRAEELTGKAMIVAYSRKVAMEMYYHLTELRPEWKEEGKIGVVMTSSNQDPEEWFEVIGGKQGKRHKEEMARKFKNNDDPLKIAIVVDMWLTGFDVPSLATMYVFKPMSGHNLMQAIARVNRVFGDKEGGLVVDYIGIAAALKQAMRDYTRRDRDNYGDMDIAKTAYPAFLDKLDVCRSLLHGFDYADLFITEESARRSELLIDALNFLMEPEREEERDDFNKEAHAMQQAQQLCKSMVNKHDRIEAAFFVAIRTMLIRTLYAHNSQISPKEINKRISEIVEQGVKSEGIINLFAATGEEFSLFDPQFLDEISKMKQKNVAIEILKKLIQEQIKSYKGRNLVKADRFSAMLQEAVNRYINGMITNEEVIAELLKMAQDMKTAREEGVELGLSDEELAFYDAITRPEAVKDFYDNNKLVEMTRELTEQLRKSRTIDWQIKESARSDMRRKVKRLLKRYKYPPEGLEDALDTVITQCELWVDIA